MELNSITIAQSRFENQLRFDQVALERSLLHNERRLEQLRIFRSRSQIVIEACFVNLRMIVRMASAQRTSLDVTANKTAPA